MLNVLLIIFLRIENLFNIQNNYIISSHENVCFYAS